MISRGDFKDCLEVKMHGQNTAFPSRYRELFSSSGYSHVNVLFMSVIHISGFHFSV